ncbi:hypothetical protein QUA07_28190, partial [Microcoleus sp. T3_A4]|uniref:hypothetical protein n=1 Tax=Microcoleus sp. T3_A4 TaxID=2818968 RepID=UPI002FD3CE90
DCTHFFHFSILLRSHSSLKTVRSIDIITVVINCLPSIDRVQYWFFSSSFPGWLKIYDRIHSSFQTGGISLC